MVLSMVTGDFLAMSATTDNVEPSPMPNAWRRRFQGGERTGWVPDFLDLFNVPGLRINPVLYALEGEGQNNPILEVEKAKRALQSALPKARIVGELQGLMGLLNESAARTARERMFLLRVAPFVTAPVSNKKRDTVWATIVAEAKDCGVKMSSLVVLAVLSAIFVAKGRSPARRLLKFRDGYNLTHANNALADLRSISILMGFFAFFPEQRAMLCTSDRDLALFWLGIRPSNFSTDGGRASFVLTPTCDLFPHDALDQWRAVAA
jgi:hypothetical protein